ncbi:MAG: arsenate reductase (glutaredoxin) [Gammaproteobacteria bacterium]|nr:arsenate reductase (glutaredoxin) [Gammaproteobacteria bacterium]
MKPRIYHNPRCSKSRTTLELLRSRGIEPEVIEYLKAPPPAQALKALLGKLGLEPRDIVRTGEAEFKESGIDLSAADDDTVLALIAEHPKILQRPIVETARAARIGRPPEQVLELFE